MLSTPNFEAAVRRAEQRGVALGEDLVRLKDHVRETSPEELASASEKRDRRRFLESLYDERRDADAAFERIIQGNELQDASFLARGALVANTVMRVVLQAPGGATRGYGTGFLIGDGVLLTNNHVLSNRDQAERALAEAFYERDIYGSDFVPWRFAFDTALFYTSTELDFTVVGLAPRSFDGARSLDSLGWLPLIGGTGKATEGEWLTIIQHPAGERKQLCVRENQLLKRDTDVLWYSTDTLAGSSGSPVFNNDWLLVALHHSGVPETMNGKWQTVTGQDYDPNRHGEGDIKWKANEGIRVSRIVETLRTAPDAIGQQRLQGVISTDVQDLRARLPVLYKPGLGPPTEVLVGRAVPTTATSPPGPNPPHGRGPAQKPASHKDDDMAEKLVTVTLAVDDDGSVRVVGQDGGSESFALEAKKKAGVVIDAPVDEERDWIPAGAGFDPMFLDVDGQHPEWRVDLPRLSAANTKLVAPLQTKRAVYNQAIPTNAAAIKAGVLHYMSSTVVMNGARRLAFFSAANIDGAQRHHLSRPTDRWLLDKRISSDHQLDNSYYTNNKFDRGHLTRREDLEWGRDPVDATRRANGTCTWTNCSPQHKTFNQDKDFPGKTAALWAGLENYILEETARHYQFRVQSFTGAVFDANDLDYRGAKVPARFWKLVVAVDASDGLFATAYVLSQQQLLDLDRNNLEEAAQAVPFGAFEAYQVAITELEAEIGMTFTGGKAGASVSLRDFDPLANELKKPAWKRRKCSGNGTLESFGADARPLGGALEGFGDIVLPED